MAIIVEEIPVTAETYVKWEIKKQMEAMDWYLRENTKRDEALNNIEQEQINKEIKKILQHIDICLILPKKHKKDLSSHLKRSFIRAGTL